MTLDDDVDEETHKIVVCHSNLVARTHLAEQSRLF